MQKMKLYKIVSSGVDIVLVVAKAELTLAEKQELIDEATESADMRGEVHIDDTIEIPEGFLDEGRPFIG